MPYLTKCPDGGNGSHAGLKIQFFRECRFESDSGYKVAFVVLPRSAADQRFMCESHTTQMADNLKK